MPERGQLKYPVENIDCYIKHNRSGGLWNFTNKKKLLEESILQINHKLLSTQS